MNAPQTFMLSGLIMLEVSRWRPHSPWLDLILETIGKPVLVFGTFWQLILVFAQ